MDLLWALARNPLAVLVIVSGLALASVMLVRVALLAARERRERRRPDERGPLAAAWRGVALNSWVMLLLSGGLAAAIGARIPFAGLVVYVMLALPHAVVLLRSRGSMDPFAIGLAKGMAVVTLVLVAGAFFIPECSWYYGCASALLGLMIWAPGLGLLLVLLLANLVRVLRSATRIREHFPEASPSRIKYRDGVRAASVWAIGVPVAALVVRLVAGVMTSAMQEPAAPQATMQHSALPPATHREAPRLDESSLPVAAAHTDAA